MKARILFTALAAAACLAQAQTPAAGARPSWQSFVRVTTSEFDSSVKLESPELSEGTFYNVPARAWSLRTLIDKKTKATTHYLIFDDRYNGEWRFWSSATSDAAEDLRTIQVSRDVGSCSRYSGCSHYERMGVVIPDAMMERALKETVRIRLAGRGVNYVIALNSTYVEYLTDATRDQLEELRTGKKIGPVSDSPGNGALIDAGVKNGK